MAWDSSNRRKELPKNWGSLREACKQAAGGQCQALLRGPPPQQRCPTPGADAHHPTPNDHSTLLWLCPYHHNRITQQQAAEARAKAAARGDTPRDTRPPTPHPGLRHT
jgi:5-methylcytosine-specific restriction enzyme A